MKQKLLLTGALALSGMLAACDDGRYLVGILGGQGPNPNMPGAGGAAGMAGMPGGAGGGGGMAGQSPPFPAPPPSLCAQPPAPLPARALRISTDQVAERLSRFLFIDRPGPDLIMRASALRNSADVQQLARTMLDEGPARVGVPALFHDWLGLDAVHTAPGAPTIRSELTPELRAAVRYEANEFVRQLFFEGDRRLRTLLTASHTVINQELATLYGLPAPPAPWIRVMLDPRQRSGVLTLPALLIANPRATQRGSWLHKQLLCQEIPPPPQGITQPDIERPVPMKSARQQLEEAVAPPVCTGCHRVMDPPGFALEHFDPLGRWRDSDNGVPVDSTASLTSFPQGGGYMVDGAPQLGAALAGDCSVQVCAVRTFLQRALGGILRSEDEPSVGAVWAQFARSDFDLRELVIAVTGSEAFLAP